MGELAHHFGRIEVRPIERQLLIDGQAAVVGSRAFDLLLALVERSDRVVSKGELLDLVWPGLVVEENNLQVQVSALRKLIGARSIATIPGRGYRLALAADAAGWSATSAEPPSAAGNLPAAPTALIGRDDELAALLAQLEQQRLVSVIGTAGVGKTTLALAAARSLRARWPDGAWQVELAEVADPTQLPQAVAQALNIALGGAETRDPLLGVLQSRSLLLMLDNCEHVVDAAAALAAAILAHAPRVRLLVTSQELLNVQGEAAYRLEPLRLPGLDEAAGDGARFGALRLFAERAKAVDPAFELGSDNAATVAAICRHLDGLPLAIELAAARVRMFGLQGVHDRLGERFRMLTGGARTSMRRHQTLRAAIEWSHGLLSADEQIVFRRLGVFAGGFTTELAQQVVVDARLDDWGVLDAISALADKSILGMRGGAAPRHVLLETARAFALDKLAQANETEVLRCRHAAAVRAVFELADDQRWGEHGCIDETTYLSRLGPEVDNLRAALGWAADTLGAESTAIALAAASAVAMREAGLAAQALPVLRRLAPLVGPATDPALAARFWCALVGVGRDRLDDDVFAPAVERAEHGCRALGWQRALYAVLCEKAWRLIRRLDFDAAEAALAETGKIEQTSWPGWLRSDRLNTVALWLANSGRYGEAEAVYPAIDALLPAHGEPRRRIRLTVNRAGYLTMQGRCAQALELLQPLVDAVRLDRHHSEASIWAYGHLVLALTQLGRLVEARPLLREALPLWRASGILHMWLDVAVLLLATDGRIADACRLAAARAAMPPLMLRRDALSARLRDESRRLVDATAADQASRERWRREGEALDEAGIVATCIGAGDPIGG